MNERDLEHFNEYQQAVNESRIEAGALEDDCHTINKRYMRKKRVSRLRESIYGQAE